MTLAVDRAVKPQHKQTKLYHLIDDVWKILKIRLFLLEVFFKSKMNNDADFLFIAVRQQMIGFSDMANSFDLEG